MTSDSEDVVGIARDTLQTLAAQGLLDNCLPEQSRIFHAFDLTPIVSARVVILGQDPYPNASDAMGLAFSSPAERHPASLRNIFTELESDIGCARPISGDLSAWARQGVLLANTALTLSADGSSHFSHWRSFTQAWIKKLCASRTAVWLLWGRHAQQWKPVIERSAREQVVIESAHPSPLSAYRGFFGSRPFSRTNAALCARGERSIDWRLPR